MYDSGEDSSNSEHDESGLEDEPSSAEDSSSSENWSYQEEDSAEEDSAEEDIRAELPQRSDCLCRKPGDVIKFCHSLDRKKMSGISLILEYDLFTRGKSYVATFALRDDPRALFVVLLSLDNEFSGHITSGVHSDLTISFRLGINCLIPNDISVVSDLECGVVTIMRRTLNSGVLLDPVIVPDEPGLYKPLVSLDGFVPEDGSWPSFDESYQQSNVVDGHLVLLRRLPLFDTVSGRFPSFRDTVKIPYCIGTCWFDALKDGFGFKPIWHNVDCTTPLLVDHAVDEHFMDYITNLLFLVDNDRGRCSSVSVAFHERQISFSGNPKLLFDLSEHAELCSCPHAWEFVGMCMITHRRMFIAHMTGRRSTMLLLLDYSGNVLAKTFLEFVVKRILYHPIFHTIALFQQFRVMFVERLRDLFVSSALTWSPSSHFMTPKDTRCLIECIFRMRTLAPECLWDLLPNELLFMIFSHL